ncbi:hypothetical protein NC651_017186 [Populus alba x Populus x berolinensis]|nr:hypothetical protein NC651_017186 [Populus alba x Populus x berolinensis]
MASSSMVGEDLLVGWVVILKKTNSKKVRRQQLVANADGSS